MSSFTLQSWGKGDSKTFDEEVLRDRGGLEGGEGGSRIMDLGRAERRGGVIVKYVNS